MEFWWQGGSQTKWAQLIKPIYVDVDANVTTQQADLTVPAGEPGIIIGCPRMKGDDGWPEYYQDDGSGEDVEFRAFCIWFSSPDVAGKMLRPRDARSHRR